MLHLRLAIALILTASIPASAISIVVSNASFEFPSLSAGESTYAAGPMQFTPEQSFAIPGWGGSLGHAPGGALIVVTGVRNGTNAVDGNQTLYIRAQVGTSGQLGKIWQDVGEVLPNTIYTLKVAAGGPLSGISDGASGFMGLMLDTVEGTPLAFTSFTSIGDMRELSEYSASCKTGPSATGRLLILLSMSALPGPYPYEVNFDNVRLEAFPAPTLTITVSDGGVSLGWPEWATNYWLEASRDPSINSAWRPLTNTAALATNQLVLPLLPEVSSFYRLRYP